MRRQDLWPLGAVGFVLAVTAAWWGFALWSIPGAPDWVERARTVCFNLTDTGLPDAKGWMLLVGQPPLMLALLWVGWRREVTGSMRRLVALPAGRAATVAVIALTVTGAGLTVQKVGEAAGSETAWVAAGPAADDHPRLDRPWPELGGLVDQTGAAFSHARLAGKQALVTFAFGHCETLCPVVVEQARAAREALSGAGADPELALVVITLDPWRDTPARLPGLFRQWGLDPARDFVVGGPVESVEAGLDAWGLARTRDLRTGDIVHAGMVYLVEADGTIAFASAGGLEHLVSLAKRLAPSPRS